MGNQLKKLNCKHSNHHHHYYDDEEVYEPERKRQKPNQNESLTDAAEEPVTISNICYDCLERIIDYLDLQSLLNVAGTCTWLQAAAVAKYDKKYRAKRVYLDLYSPYARAWIHVDRNEINLSCLKTCLPFLRCFGDQISDLVVNFNNDDRTTEYVDQYINQYCTENLVKISQVQRTYPITNLQKPFKNVEKIDITSSCLGKYLPKFVDLFPNVRQLELYYVSFEKTALKRVSFPQLEHLTLIVESSKRRQYFTHENTAKFLHAHRKLQQLNLMLYGTMSLSTLLRLISANRCLTKLSVMIGLGYSDSFVDVNMVEMNRFVAKHTLIEELNVLNFRFTADDAVRFIDRMTSLKLFKFQVKDRYQRDCLIKQLSNGWKYHFWTFNRIFYIKLKR